jgi:hypothetical protein
VKVTVSGTSVVTVNVLMMVSPLGDEGKMVDVSTTVSGAYVVSSMTVFVTVEVVVTVTSVVTTV